MAFTYGVWGPQTSTFLIASGGELGARALPVRPDADVRGREVHGGLVGNRCEEANPLSPLLERLRAALAPRYEVQGSLGSGGMAFVFRARDSSLERPVAIKVLRPQLATAIGAERFIREAKHLANLSHPHLVSVHAAGEADGLYYYVMDLIEDDSLDRVLARGPLPPATAIQIVAGLLEALEVVHASGLVHRDVKPENIFLQGDHPLLADFGIAKSMDARKALTKTGAFMGTPAYMSPEQAQGFPVGPASDLYSVGQVLFQCITGRQWSLGASGETVDWSGVPPALRPILTRALQPIPAHRWPDAASFRTALSRAAVDESTPIRRGWWYTAAAAVVVVASLLLWSVVVRESPEEMIESVAVGWCEDTSPNEDLAGMALAVGEALSRALRRVEPDLTVKDYGAWQGPLNVQMIGDSLGVDAVASCSVRSRQPRIQGRVRLTVVQTGGDVLDWSFDMGVVELDSQVASQIAGALDPQIRTREARSLGDNAAEAVEAFIDGRLAWSRRTEDGEQLEVACERYAAAFRLAPTFALAVAGLAECYVALSGRALARNRTGIPRSSSRRWRLATKTAGSPLSRWSRAPSAPGPR